MADNLEKLETHYANLGIEMVLVNQYRKGKYDIFIIRPYNKYGAKLVLEYVVYDENGFVGSTIVKDQVNTVIEMAEKWSK